jgi:hypothetical protein
MNIPMPVKILGGLLLTLFIASMAGSVSGLFGLIAVIAWIAAATVVLHVAGLVPPGIWLSVASMVTKVLAPTAKAMAPATASPFSGAAPAATPRQSRQSDLESSRPKAFERGQNQLKAMIGSDPARTEIFEKIVPLARTSATKGKRLLGASRALVVLITGPHGVGKSAVAHALADMFYGLSVVDIPILSEIPAPSGSRLAPDWALALEEGLDGVTLVDNATWLLQSHPLTGGLHVDGFLEAVTQVANSSPGKLTLVISLTDKDLEAIHQRASFRDLLRRLTVRHLAMRGMEPLDLVTVLESQLQKQQLRLPSGQTEAIRRLIKRYSDSENFDNAEAMRRVAEGLVEGLMGTNRYDVTLEELDAAFEAKC